MNRQELIDALNDPRVLGGLQIRVEVDGFDYRDVASLDVQRGVAVLQLAAKANAASLTVETIQAAMARARESQPRVCPHVFHPRQVETDGWHICADCFQPVPIRDGRVDYSNPPSISPSEAM